MTLLSNICPTLLLGRRCSDGRLLGRLRVEVLDELPEEVEEDEPEPK